MKNKRNVYDDIEYIERLMKESKVTIDDHECLYENYWSYRVGWWVAKIVNLIKDIFKLR